MNNLTRPIIAVFNSLEQKQVEDLELVGNAGPENTAWVVRNPLET